MTTVCFVCNLPILSHQVGLVWTGSNGWDELARCSLEDYTVRQRLGYRRESGAQVTYLSPQEGAADPPKGTQRRRRSSLAHLSELFREWSGTNKRNLAKIHRRETLADLARSMPPSRSDASSSRRRESSADSGIKSFLTRRRASKQAAAPRSEERKKSDFSFLTKYWHRQETVNTEPSREKNKKKRRDSGDNKDRRESVDDYRPRRESIAPLPPPPRIVTTHRKRSISPRPRSRADASSDVTTHYQPSVAKRDLHSTADIHKPSTSAMPTIISSAITPSPTTPTTPHFQKNIQSHHSHSPSPAPQPSTSGIKSTNVSGRRDSTTQCGRSRRESRSGISPEGRFGRLQRQGTAFDDPSGPPGAKRRDSGPTLGPEDIRRDSLSPDSAVRPRRERSQLSPDRGGGGGGGTELSPSAARRRGRLRRQASCARGRRHRSPESSSCSSRDPSPCARPPERPIVRRQSTTEEILIARGFRRQSTTEEMMRCRNFRRQSSQSDDAYMRSKGRRDSCTQIDGTLGTMTVETTSTFFDSSTQTEPSPIYDNNHYHEECLRCNSCGTNMTGSGQRRARRYKNQILCDLHYSDIALMECSDFMQQLRSFKPQSLGCAVARRKSSTTLIFPLPPQACSDEFCEEYPHNVTVTPGYWIECSRHKIVGENVWFDSESDSDREHQEYDRKIRSGKLDEAEECNCENGEASAAPKKKTVIEEQWEEAGCFELTSVEQETYEKHFYNQEHWNYFTVDEDLGPVILSIRQEYLNGRDQFRILVRGISYTVHGLIPASCVFADRYNREEVVKSLGKEVNLNPPLVLGQLPDTPSELVKLDQVFIKSELKVGVIYVKEGQTLEEEILDNNENTPLFEEFLDFLGERTRLKGFEKYKGGLDTVHDLTGLYSVYRRWHNIEIMFHVSTLLPYERHDPQKLQRKRHIGNDIVCIVFMEADNTSFSPACIKSHFLHTFILVRVSAKIKREPTQYEISVVTRDEVGAYKPYLWEQSVFEIGPMFREWLLTKIVNGERASYSAPKFARMQERTRSQMLEDVVANLQNHAETGQIPKPYRRGSWRPIGHMRPSSPLLDSVRNQFEDVEQLAKDFTKVFINNEINSTKNSKLFDVAFLVGQSKQKTRLVGVRAILGVRSRVFQEMLYGIQTGFGSPQVPVADILSRPAPNLMAPPVKLKSSNFLQVPDRETPRPKSVPSSPMVKRAFSRLGTLTAGWGRSIRKQHSNLNSDDKKKWTSSHDCSNKPVKEKDKGKATGHAAPRLSVCADVQKVDRAKLAQTEFIIIEFDADTFRILLDYLHTGSCPLTCATIPGLICAAEHYDLPDLLQACFHHAKQFLKIGRVCNMLISLENYYWRYTSASELMNMVFAFIEQRAYALFQLPEFLDLSESMVQMIMCRNLEVPEVRKFEAMLHWAENKVQNIIEPTVDKKYEFHRIMGRLTTDLKLHRISPQELIKVVLPTKAIKNEKILETLTHQAKTGVYRINQTHIQAIKSQEPKYAEMEKINLGI